MRSAPDTFCRPWLDTLQLASYRGAEFWVEHDIVETGRRLVVHEFPHKDEPYIEDLGRKANQIMVTAYVTGDPADERAKDLLRACDAGGSALLVLPITTMMAHCEDCKREHNKDKLGHIAFGLKFWREGNDLESAVPLLSMARAVEFGASAIVGSLAIALSDTFDVLGRASYVGNAAADDLRAFLSDFDDAVRRAPVDPDKLADIRIRVADAVRDADELCAIGHTGDRYASTRYVADQRTASGEALASLVTGLFGDTQDALEPVYGVEFLAPWITWARTPAPVTTPSTRLIASNTEALNLLVEASATAQYAAAVVLRQYGDVREARQARADAAEYFDAMLNALQGWRNFAAWTELAELRRMVEEFLYRTITSLAPILQVSASRPMPSAWWAWRLYGDATRSAELVTRNGIKHASFMPLEFEALLR